MAKFTVKTLLTIKVDPEHKAINKIMQFLYDNAATLLEPQGGGNHGHTIITM